MNTKIACKLAREFEGVTEKDHFGSDAFYANKRIFATVWHERGEVNLRLTPKLQDQYVELDGNAFSRIDNAWGRQGWTTTHLDSVEKKVFVKALQSAWDETFRTKKKVISNRTSAKRKKSISKVVKRKTKAVSKKVKG